MKSNKIILIIMILFSAGIIHAAPECKDIFQMSVENSAESHFETLSGPDLWTRLLIYGKLVDQHYLEDGKGYCGVACSLNLMQAAAFISEKPGLKNRYKTFTKIARSNLYDKKANGMTLSQMIKTIQWLSKTVFGNNRPTVTAKLLKSKHGAKQQELSEISSVDFFSKEDFQTTESMLKSIMTIVLDKNLKFKGAHVQIITDFDGHKITMVDSNDLSLRFTATLEDTVSFDETTVPLFKYTEETLKEFPHKMPEYFSPFAVISVDVGNISDYSLKARIQETIRNIFKGKKSGTP